MICLHRNSQKASRAILICYKYMPKYKGKHLTAYTLRYAGICYAGLCSAMPRCASTASSMPLPSIHPLKTSSDVKERNQPRPRMTVDVLKRHLTRLQSRHLMPRAELERRLAEFGGVSVGAVEDFVMRLVL